MNFKVSMLEDNINGIWFIVTRDLIRNSLIRTTLKNPFANSRKYKRVLWLHLSRCWNLKTCPWKYEPASAPCLAHLPQRNLCEYFHILNTLHYSLVDDLNASNSEWRLILQKFRSKCICLSNLVMYVILGLTVIFKYCWPIIHRASTIHLAFFE